MPRAHVEAFSRVFRGQPAMCTEKTMRPRTCGCSRDPSSNIDLHLFRSSFSTRRHRTGARDRTSAPRTYRRRIPAFASSAWAFVWGEDLCSSSFFPAFGLFGIYRLSEAEHAPYHLCPLEIVVSADRGRLWVEAFGSPSTASLVFGAGLHSSHRPRNNRHPRNNPLLLDSSHPDS